MVLVDSRGISRVPRYSGTCPASQSAVIYRAVTVYGRSFQIVRLANWLVTCRPCGLTGPTTPPCKHDGLGCSAFARRYWRNHCCFLFLWVLRWFTSPGLLQPPYFIQMVISRVHRDGFPHSEICGSKDACSSPQLIAACHVLHRLEVPRHPPCALSSLTIKFTHEQQTLFDLKPLPRKLWSLIYFSIDACTVKLALCVFFADITPQQSQISNFRSEIISTLSEEAYFFRELCVTSDNSHYSIVKDLLLLTFDQGSKLQHSNRAAYDIACLPSMAPSLKAQVSTN